MQDIQGPIEEGLRKMTFEELNGAHYVIDCLDSYFRKNNKGHDIRKAIEELNEICIELFVHEHRNTNLSLKNS